MKSSCKILFYLRRDRVNKDGKAPLFCRITVSGEAVRFNLTLSCRPEIWNSEFARATGRGQEAMEINHALENYHASILKTYRQILERDNYVTAEKVRDSFLGFSKDNVTLLSIFDDIIASTVAEAMTADSFVSMLLAREWDYRSEAAIQRLISQAGFRYKAFLEEIDYSINRSLDRNRIERLASLDFIRQGQNLFITGLSGTGKSYIATALGYQACKEGIRTNYASASKLMGALKVAKTKGGIETELKKIERCPLLILDDLFLVPLDAKERPILLDIIEDRHERKSIIITSQLPVADWYDAIGEPTVADAILNRIVHSAHQIELTGESVRKMKVGKNK